jgi:hypothetical protein
MMHRFLFAFPTATVIALSLGSCVGGVAVVPQAARPVPVPVPTPSPAPRPQPAPVAPTISSDWRDWPALAGVWSYRQDAQGSIALFGRTGADANFTMRCDRTRGRIYLSLRTDIAGPMTFRTSSTSRTLNALPTGGSPAYVAAEFDPRDPLLDALGYSRGHFAITMPGQSPWTIPAWAEMLRVVEDCR